MTRRNLLSLLATLILIPIRIVRAQAPAEIPRIGYLSSGLPPFGLEAFRQGLQELGYIDGKNIRIEARYAGAGFNDPSARRQRQLELAQELVRLNVVLIVTTATDTALAAQRATRTIPIIGGLGGDPVAAGLVASLSRPGGNITGVTSMSGAVGHKRLELLKDVSARIAPVAVLWIAGNTGGNALQMKEMERAAKRLSIHIMPVAVQGTDFASAFSALRNKGARSLILIGSPMFASHRPQIAELAATYRLPAIYTSSQYVDAGGLMSYGVNLDDFARQIAHYVDRILKGANPAVLPVERPTKFELVINLRAAKKIGLTIPESVLDRADRVID